jgi:hypothetical protein
MLDQNIQEALSQLDKNSKKTMSQSVKWAGVFGFFIVLLVAGGLWMRQEAIPTVSEEQLSRLIVVASRTSDNDPIRLLGDVERHMGKKFQNFSKVERANALSYLIQHIELDHRRQELISY